MSVKAHYDTHLASFYSWMLGDFDEKKNEFKNICESHKVFPIGNGKAIDLGAGNGIQSFALEELGFEVHAIDFNEALLNELTARDKTSSIKVTCGDIREFNQHIQEPPELIICCGDTLTHLDSKEEIEQLIQHMNKSLPIGGKILLSFRDYGVALEGHQRFIPVKSDADRILTCFLEYSEEKVCVTDILHENINGNWEQKISSYEKVRVTQNQVKDFIENNGFEVHFNEPINRQITIIAVKRKTM